MVHQHTSLYWFTIIFKKFLFGPGWLQEWLQRSRDLNRLYFLWGYLKTLVFTLLITSDHALREGILVASNRIKNSPDIFQQVRNSIKRKSEAYISSERGHFQKSFLSKLCYLYVVNWCHTYFNFFKIKWCWFGFVNVSFNEKCASLKKSY